MIRKKKGFLTNFCLLNVQGNRLEQVPENGLVDFLWVVAYEAILNELHMLINGTRQVVNLMEGLCA